MKKIFLLILLVCDGCSDECVYSGQEYAQDVRSYAEQYGLDGKWVGWMLENESYVARNYCTVKKLKSKEIVGSVSYLKDMAKLYTVPWASEEEHAEKLQEMLNLAFVGWNFSLVAGSSPAATDFTLFLGADGHSRALAPDKVWLNKGESVFVHEVAHLFYAKHHYVNDGRIAKGDYMPPGEEACIMDASYLNFCSAHKFAFGIPAGVDYLKDKEIWDLEVLVDSHYE